VIHNDDIRAALLRAAEGRDANVAAYARQAAEALADEDYSMAATFSHRAHQQKLVAQALRDEAQR